MKRLGGSDSFTGTITVRILLWLTHISVGLEDMDVTAKISGENNLPFFSSCPYGNEKNSGLLNHTAQDGKGYLGHTVCSSECCSFQCFAILTNRISFCYAS